MIGLSALVVAGTVSLSSVQRTGGLPVTSQWLSLAVVYLALSLVSDLGGGPIASAMALLVMVSVLLTRTDDVLKLIRRRSGPTPQQAASAIRQATPRRPGQVPPLR